MPQFNSVTVQDRETTPVSHVFTPRDISNGVATLVETTGVPIGENRVGISLTKTQQGRYKPVLKFQFPIVATQTVNGVSTPTVVRSTYATVEFSFHETSSLQERKNAVEMVRQFLSNGVTVPDGVLTKLEMIY